MKSWNRLKPAVYFALLFAPSILFFQNCSRPNDIILSSNQPDSGGPGTDGMVFKSYGLCLNNKIGVASEIVVARDRSSAALTVQNCADLQVPQSVSLSDLQFGANDSSVLQLSGRVYDEQVNSGTQKVTIQLCQSGGTQVSIWQEVGSSSAYFGSITPASGPASGTLNVQTPATPGEYVSSSGQASSFDLNVTSASLTYSINGGTQVQLTGVTCASQTAPTYQDGSAGAPAGQAQLQSLLAGYTSRAPWKVAGVDYPVGYPNNLVLKDPATINIVGVSLDSANHWIRVTGNNVTLDGYDFSLEGGWGIDVTGSNPTITDNYFQMGPVGVNPILIEAGSGGGGTIANNVINGNNVSLSGGSAALIDLWGSGTYTIEYNWVKNSQLNFVMGGNTSQTQSNVIQFNVFENNGSGQTGNWFLGSGAGSVYQNLVITFNTYIDNQSNQKSQGINLDTGTNVQYQSVNISNNTIVLPLAASVSTQINSAIMINTSELNGSAQVSDNYVDITGISGAWLSIEKLSGPYSGTVNQSGNVNMNSGNSL